MTKEEAIQIAEDYKSHKGSIYENSLVGATLIEGETRVWKVIFFYLFPDGVSIEPSDSCVYVDDETGQVTPVMGF